MLKATAWITSLAGIANAAVTAASPQLQAIWSQHPVWFAVISSLGLILTHAAPGLQSKN